MNLKLQISDVHVRFEDPETPFCAGVSIGQLKINSINPETREECQFKEGERTVTKLAELKEFSAYCGSSFTPVASFQGPIPEYLRQNIARATSGAALPDFNYLIKPMSVDLTLTMDRTPADQRDPSVPATSVSVAVQNTNLNISAMQINAFMRELQTQLFFGSQQRRPELRPLASEAEGGKVSPKQWMRYLFQTYESEQDNKLEFRLVEKYELRQYMKLFAQHYINCNSKEGQQRLEALKKEGRQTFSYPFCREYPCMCDQVEQNKQMHFYHIVLRPDEIRLARAVVIKHLFQYKKNGFRELLKMKNPKYEFDPTTSAVKQTLREEKHEIKAQRVQEVADVNGIKLQFKIQFNKLELQLNANTVLPDDRLRNVMDEEQSISVPVTPTSPVQQKNSKFFQQEYETVILPKLVGTPTDCRSVILFKLDDLNFGLNLRFND